MNRIDHIIWIVRPENLERYVLEATRLFGVEFEHLSDPTAVDASKDIYISFDGGLEFIAPLAPNDYMSQRYIEFLETHGEGLYGFVFRVKDLNASIAHARDLAYPATDLLQSADQTVRRAYLARYTRRCTDAQEAYIGEVAGTSVLFGELDYSDQLGLIAYGDSHRRPPGGPVGQRLAGEGDAHVVPGPA